MPDLSSDNINLIISDVRKQEISFSHLPDELIDHLCCDVEDEMLNGLDFSEAYKRVKQKFGKRRLKEIQEETLYAVDTKYRRMKKTMKISGIAGTILLGFAALFKIQHWAGAGIMLTLGALSLAFVFLPSSLRVLWKETHNRNRLFLFISSFIAGFFFILGTVFKIQHWSGAGILLLLAYSGALMFVPSLLVIKLGDQENKPKRPVYIAGAVALILYVTGIFFKLQHWQGATLLILSGLIIMFAYAFPAYSRKTWKDEKYITSTFLFIVIGALVINIPGTLINLKLQQSYEGNYYTHQEQQQALSSFLNKKNIEFLAVYKDSINYSTMEQFHKNTLNLLTVIGNIQAGIVREAEELTGKPAPVQDLIIESEGLTEVKYRYLTGGFNPLPENGFPSPESKWSKDIDNALKDYISNILTVIPADKLRNYTQLLSLPLKFREGNMISIITGLHSLELLKNSILAAEAGMLKDIAQNQ
jgi:hypothetical protein